MNDINSALNGPLKNPPFSDAQLQQEYNQMLNTAWKAMWNYKSEARPETYGHPDPTRGSDPTWIEGVQNRIPPEPSEHSEMNGLIEELRSKFETFLTPRPDTLVGIAEPCLKAIHNLGTGQGSKGAPGSNYNAQDDFAGIADEPWAAEGFKGTAADKFFVIYPNRHAGRVANQVKALNATEGAMKACAGIHHQARTDVYTIAKEADKQLRPLAESVTGDTGGGSDVTIALAVLGTLAIVIGAVASGGAVAAPAAAAVWTRVAAAGAIGIAMQSTASTAKTISDETSGKLEVSLQGKTPEDLIHQVFKALDQVRNGIEQQERQLIQGIGAARDKMHQMWSTADGSTNILQVPAPGDVKTVATS